MTNVPGVKVAPRVVEVESGVKGAVPPAESRPVRDRRTTSEIGRRARLELVFSAHKGRTILSHGYAEPPLRIGRGFEQGAALHFILTSSAPGLFGGDVIDQSIRVEAGADVQLASQSALQLHPSLEADPVRVASRYDVCAGGSLSCWWDPLIPFAGSMLEQSIAIDLAPGARLTWCDALMSGRSGRGERWAFSRLSHELRLSCEERLLYLERYRLEPSVLNAAPATHGPYAPRLAESMHYFGTTFRVGHGDDAKRMEAVQRAMSGMPEVAAAADLFVDDDLLLVRLAAATGASFHRARRAAVVAFDAVLDDMLHQTPS